MNTLQATVKQIDHLDSLYIVTFEWHGADIKMVSLDLDQKLEKYDEVILGVNFTSVAVAKMIEGELSYTNQLDAKVDSVEKGKLLSVVELTYGDDKLESLLLTESIDRLELKAGDEVKMIIKANDIFLQEVIS